MDVALDHAGRGDGRLAEPRPSTRRKVAEPSLGYVRWSLLLGGASGRAETRRPTEASCCSASTMVAMGECCSCSRMMSTHAQRV